MTKILYKRSSIRLTSLPSTRQLGKITKFGVDNKQNCWSERRTRGLIGYRRDASRKQKLKKKKKKKKQKAFLSYSSHEFTEKF